MPRMSIDDRAGRDPRVAHLAKLQGWSLRETRGCLAFEVWPLCYDRATPFLRRLDIELATGSDSLAQNMIAAGLATETKHGLRIAGASDRVEYLLRAKDAGRRGGKASGKSRASNEPLKGSRTNPEGSTNPSASALPTPNTPALPDQSIATPPARVSRKPKVELSPGEQKIRADYQAATDAYFRRFETAYGKKPTFTAKHGAQINRLLKAHGLAEFDRRLEILFTSPPHWLKGPYDLGTLESQFDKLVQPSLSVVNVKQGRIEPHTAEAYADGEVAL
jgi:hypothetical protein